MITSARIGRSVLRRGNGPVLRLIEWLCSRELFEREHSLDLAEKILLKSTMAKLAAQGQSWDDQTDDLE